MKFEPLEAVLPDLVAGEEHKWCFDNSLDCNTTQLSRSIEKIIRSELRTCQRQKTDHSPPYYKHITHYASHVRTGFHLTHFIIYCLRSRL